MKNLAGGSTYEFHECYIRLEMLGVGVGRSSMRWSARALLTLLAAFIFFCFCLLSLPQSADDSETTTSLWYFTIFADFESDVHLFTTEE